MPSTMFVSCVHQDITVIYRRRGANDLIQDHLEWRKTVKSNPDVLFMSFISIHVLLDPCPAQDNLERAIEAYLTYKPPSEELQCFFEFRVPVAWAPVVDQVSYSRKEPVCPSLRFSLMGPKLFISTEQVSVGKKPITGLRSCLEGSKLNRLAVHVQHLAVLPKILQPHWDVYVPIGAPKWHGPEEQDSRWFEPVLWKNFAHVSTAPVEFSETWFGDASSAYIVTGAQLGVWDFGLKSVLHLKLLYSKVPGCTIRRSVWDHTLEPLGQTQPTESSTLDSVPTPTTPMQTTQKLSKFVDTFELKRGPGHCLVSISSAIGSNGVVECATPFPNATFPNFPRRKSEKVAFLQRAQRYTIWFTYSVYHVVKAPLLDIFLDKK